MFAMRAPSPLEDELTRLAEGLEGLDMRTAAHYAPDLLAERDRIVGTVRCYLIPRLADPGRPMTVVIAGPTGSGKSTVLNSLAGLDLAETGPLRPTTKTPLVATTAAQAHRFRRLGGVLCHIATARTPILTRIALVDTPDLDSTSVEHRAMAESLIDSADVVVFVTSPLRYADRVPWEVLRRAVERGAPVITVLNRLTASSAGAVTDYRARLARAGLEIEMVRVPEQRRGAEAQRLPSLAVKELGRRLRSLADDLEGGRLAGRAVAATVLGDVSRLADALAGLTRLLQLQREQVEALVSGARAGLDLDGVLDGIAPPAARAGRLRRLLRLPGRPLPQAELADWLSQVSARLTSVVESELRATAVELGSLVPSAPSRVVIEPALVTLATAIHGWLAHVRRVTEALGRRDPHRAAAALMMRSLGAGDQDMAQRALGPGHAGIAERARAELESRLSVAFSQLAVLASARLDAIAGPGIETVAGIEELITRANARLTFADA